MLALSFLKIPCEFVIDSRTNAGSSNFTNSLAIGGLEWEGCHWRQNIFCCVCKATRSVNRLFLHLELPPTPWDKTKTPFIIYRNPPRLVVQTLSTAKTLITQTMAAQSGRRLLRNSFRGVLGAEASLKSNSPQSSNPHNLSSENKNGKLPSGENLVVRDWVVSEFRTGRQHLVGGDNRAPPRKPNPPSNAVLPTSCIPKAPSLRRIVKITR